MNPRLFLPVLCLWATVAVPKSHPAEADNKAARIDVSRLSAVPDGNYLVTLELGGKHERLNFKVQANMAKCVNSSDPLLKDVEGRFQLHENGTFMGRFQGRKFRGSQLWIFRSDGAAAVREVPDRGEQQSAVPVSGDSIEMPKGK